MKNNNKKIGIIVSSVIAVMISFSSCDSFFEKEPLTKLSESSVWVSPSLMEAYVNQTYLRVVTGFHNDYRMEGLSDEAWRKGRATYLTIMQGQMSSTNMVPLKLWGFHYSVITDANIFLENAEGKTYDNQKLVDRLIGEEKFLRAYAYSRLIALHGGVPLITKSFTLNDNFLIPRNSYQECLEQIIKDLDEAAAVLPVTHTSANLGRATKGAAYALKSRVLLHAASPLHNPTNDLSKWEKARDAALEVVKMGKYSLHPNYAELFNIQVSNNKEMIWDRPYNNSVKKENLYFQELYLMSNGSGGYAQTQPIQSAVDRFEMKSGLLPKEDPSYDPQNPYVDRDPRFYDCILYEGAPWQGREIEVFLPGGKDSPEGPAEGWNASSTGYYQRKYLDETVMDPNTSNCNNNHWVFIRYAEILLNCAEAYYNLGDEEKCREYLNMIRNRESVQMPTITESGDELLERLRNERFVELYFEEHRFFDVRRWKIAHITNILPANKVAVQKDLTTGKKTFTYLDFEERMFKDADYFVPIPQDEIDKNSLLEKDPG